MPARLMLIVHFCTEISEQFPIDRYKYIHDSAMRTTFPSPSIDILQSTPRIHSTDSNGQYFAHGLPDPARRTETVL